MGSLRILIAEDDPSVAMIIETLITEEGHSCCGVIPRGGDVVAAVTKLEPDLVLMDVYLADSTTGTSVTRELVRRYAVPVIVVSGTDKPEDLRNIGESGAIGFLKKPIDAEELQVNLRIAQRHIAIMQRLRKSEPSYRNIFDEAPAGIFVCHPEGHYVSCNRAFAKMLGYSGPAELLRGVSSIGLQVYVEEGRWAELFHELECGRVVRDAESRVYGRDGDIVWISESLAPELDAEGSLAYYTGVAINISDRKRAEAERDVAQSLIQITMDAMADYVVVIDLDCGIIFANKAFERELGDAVGPERILQLIDSGQCPLERFFEELHMPAPEGRSLWGYCRLAGREEKLGVGVSRFVSDEGEVLGAVLVMHEVRKKGRNQSGAKRPRRLQGTGKEGKRSTKPEGKK